MSKYCYILKDTNSFSSISCKINLVEQYLQRGAAACYLVRNSSYISQNVAIFFFDLLRRLDPAIKSINVFFVSCIFFIYTHSFTKFKTKPRVYMYMLIPAFSLTFLTKGTDLHNLLINRFYVHYFFFIGMNNDIKYIFFYLK